MIVKAFKGVRPQADLVEKVQVPPYDVVDREDVKAFLKDNPYSYFHITRPDASLPDNVDEHDPQVYQKGHENLEKFIKERTLIQDEKPAYYLNTQVWQGRTQIGLFAEVSCEEYLHNDIRKHEFTRADKEQDRTTHVKTLQANTGPVFLLFQDDAHYHKIIQDTLTQPAVYDFTDENNVHNELRVINDPTLIKKLDAYFAQLPALYIADGHHRAASAGNLYSKMKEQFPEQADSAPWSRFMAVLFPASQLTILAYNRLVLDIDTLSEEEIIRKTKEKWILSPTEKLQSLSAKTIGMYMNGQAYTLTPKPGTWVSDNPVENLDVSILQNNFLSPILGIKNPRTSSKIKFMGGIKGNKGLQNAVDTGSAKIALSLYPVSVQELMGIADHNQTMPPKSTWFEPKLRSGLVTRILKD